MPEHPHKRRLLALVNKHLPGITFYDAQNHTKLGDARTAISPHEVTFSRDGRYIFVAIYGSSGVGKSGTDEHTIHIFRSGNLSEAAAFDTGKYSRPHGIVAGASGTVYLTAENAGTVLLLEGVPHLRISGVIETGSRTSHMLAVTRDERVAFVSNVRSKDISILDIPRRTLIDCIATEGENQRMTLSPDERWFVTSLGQAAKVAFYRTRDYKLDFTVAIEGTPFVTKFSSDGKFAYNAGFASADRLGAWKIDVDAKRVVAAITEGIGHDPGSLEVNPWNGCVYISDQTTNTVHIVDPQTWTRVDGFQTSKSPDAMAFAKVDVTG